MSESEYYATEFTDAEIESKDLITYGASGRSVVCGPARRNSLSEEKDNSL